MRSEGEGPSALRPRLPRGAFRPRRPTGASVAAACGSWLAALYLAVAPLLGRSDDVVAAALLEIVVMCAILGAALAAGIPGRASAILGTIVCAAGIGWMLWRAGFSIPLFAALLAFAGAIVPVWVGRTGRPERAVALVARAWLAFILFAAIFVLGWIPSDAIEARRPPAGLGMALLLGVLGLGDLFRVLWGVPDLADPT